MKLDANIGVSHKPFNEQMFINILSRIGMSHNLSTECLVDEDGCYLDSVQHGLAGLNIQG